jgi:maltooligosyltrehalose trehalohydrolase
MLFMGEEFACERPFQFFVDFGDEQLRRAVVEGRQREYPHHDWSRGVLPIDPRAFHDSKIGLAEHGNQEMRQWYRDLMALRKQWQASGLLCDANLTVRNDLDRGVFSLEYQDGQQVGIVAVRLVANTDSDVIDIPATGDLLLDSRPHSAAKYQLIANHAKVFGG